MPKLNFSFKEDNVSPKNVKTWKVLIVDDEISVHQMTKIIMENWQFLGRSVTLLNAYSEEEARKVLAEEEDLALVFMDVIMERDDSGFRLVDYVRNDLDNKFTRIVLRTGQPGTLSIREIVQRYDINDYREKTQLSVDVLYTITSSCIRSYDNLKRMKNYSGYLEAFLHEYPSLIQTENLDALTGRLVDVICNQFNLEGDVGLVVSRGTLDGGEPLLELHAWSGSRIAAEKFSDLPEECAFQIRRALVNQQNRKEESGEYIFFRTSTLLMSVLFIGPESPLDPEMQKSLEFFLKNTAPLFSRRNSPSSGEPPEQVISPFHT